MRDKTKVHWCQKTTYKKNAGQLQQVCVCVCETVKVYVYLCACVKECERVCVCAVVHVSRFRSDEMHCQPSPSHSRSHLHSHLNSHCYHPRHRHHHHHHHHRSHVARQPVSVSWMGSAAAGCMNELRWRRHRIDRTIVITMRLCKMHMQLVAVVEPSLGPQCSPSRQPPVPSPSCSRSCCLHLHLHLSLSLHRHLRLIAESVSHGATGLTWLRTSTSPRVTLQVSRSSCKQGRSCSNWSMRSIISTAKGVGTWSALTLLMIEINIYRM